MQNRLSQLFHSPLAVLAKWLGVVAICVFGPLQAQVTIQPAIPTEQNIPQKLDRDELCHLLAPIALYPDALIALMLPASTVPADIVLGARFLATNSDPELAKNQPWDESVTALIRYPQVLEWMDKNLEWTASLGEAFVEQPADVMNALQALRAQAKSAGNLQDSPQQQVVDDETMIRILPADPQVIYVPQYDPDLVYVQSYSSGTLVTFGAGFAVGTWLCYDFDWNRRYLYHGYWHGWESRWNSRHVRAENGGGNRVSVVNIDVNNASQWQPSPSSQRQIAQRQHNSYGNARFVNARSSAIGAQQQVIQQGASSATARPAPYNPQMQTALPRPSRQEMSPAVPERNRVQPPNPSASPSAIPGVNGPVAPAQIPGQINRAIHQQTQDPTRAYPSPRTGVPTSPPARIQPQAERVPAPVSQAPQVQLTEERVNRPSQPSQPLRTSVPAARTESQPTPAIVKEPARRQYQQPQETQHVQEQIKQPQEQHSQAQAQDHRQLQKEPAPVPAPVAAKAETKTQATSSGDSHPDKTIKKKAEEKKED